MADEGLDAATAKSRRLESERGARRYRLWSNLTLTKDILVGLALLIGVGVALSIGLSALDVIPLP